MTTEPPYEPGPDWGDERWHVGTIPDPPDPPERSFWTKGRIVVASVVATLAVVVGVSQVGNTDPPGRTAATSAAPRTRVTASSQSDRDRAYLHQIRGLMPGLIKVDDRIVLAAGQSICDYWDAGGHDFRTLALTTVAQGFTAEEAGLLIGSATAQLCPEHLDEIP